MIIRRLSDEELKKLYGSRAGYVAKVTESVERMIAHGHLLPEHAHFLIEEAKEAVLPFEE